jgi:K+ transporter
VGSSLKSNNYVGISFWLITMALIASTVFFFLETQRVDGKWKTSLTVSGLVTMIAAIHYMYMREVWITEGASPTVFRYIDWLITVPLFMVEFYLILAAITKVQVGVFWRLMIGTLVMLVGGYLTGANPADSMKSLNIIYNLADVLSADHPCPMTKGSTLDADWGLFCEPIDRQWRQMPKRSAASHTWSQLRSEMATSR